MLALRFSTREESEGRGLVLEVDNLGYEEDSSGEDEFRSLEFVEEPDCDRSSPISPLM